MKFSYRLLKKLNSQIPAINKTAELLMMNLFEAAAVDKNTLEVDVLPNRYSDAASHRGIAIELGAILKKPWLPRPMKIKYGKIKNKKIGVEIKTPACRRLVVSYITGVKIKPSPKWLRDILLDCGIQPINNLVDITNYVTLETGQPLHAFDWDRAVGGTLSARPALRGEEVVSLEGKKYELNADDMVLADKEDALDVAGIKGGKKAEITPETVDILLTAGNFDGSSIYKTSRKINLQTDASLRFSHNITPELVRVGIDRAIELVLELCGGQAEEPVDVYQEKFLKHVIKFDVEKFNQLTGFSLTKKEPLKYLRDLGFKIKGDLVEAPFWRTDIELFEDLAEEVARLRGYDDLPAQPLVTALKPTDDEERIVFMSNIRRALVNLGFDEVYNYSFSNQGEVEVENPVSLAYSFLRPSLMPGLIKNVTDNFRFADQVAVFEIGHIFKKGEKDYVSESLSLGLIMAYKKSHPFLELKGRLEQLLQELGLTDIYMVEDSAGDKLRVESDHSVIGFLEHRHEKFGKAAVVEVNLDKLMELVDAERSFEPFAKFPSIIRDMSLLIPQDVRFSKVQSIIWSAAPKFLDDIDLVDFYEDKKIGYGKRSLTVRLVFLAADRTLTDKDVDREIGKISKALVDKLDVEIR